MFESYYTVCALKNYLQSYFHYQFILTIALSAVCVCKMELLIMQTIAKVVIMRVIFQMDSSRITQDII